MHFANGPAFFQAESVHANPIEIVPTHAPHHQAELRVCRDYNEQAAQNQPSDEKKYSTRHRSRMIPEQIK